MNNTKTTKRALLSSVMAMLICITMLIGTTFAWFTDTASTAVNKIQAGTLDVALEMATEWNNDGTVKTWVDAEGQTLSWKKAAGAPDNEQVLWEPGCTYELPELRIVNKGNLALKYKIQITGIQGDAKLNEAIEWTITNTSATTALDEDHRLAAGASDTLTISGQMKDSAGNEYQGLSIDNIAITVVATQDTVEYDSDDNQYDVNAVYPVAPTLSNTTVTGTIKSGEDTTLGQMTGTPSPTAAKITIPAGAVTTDTNAVFKMKLTDLSPNSVTYEISLNGETGTPVTLAQPAKVTTNIGANLTNVVVKHSDTPMTNVRSEDGLRDGTYYYNKTTGKLIICSSTFSPFEISYDYNPVASVNGVGYTTLSSAIKAANDGDTVVLTKDGSSNLGISDKNITIDLNGKTLRRGFLRGYPTISLNNNANVTIKNGTIKGKAYGIIIYGDGDKLTLDNVKIEATGSEGIGVFGQNNNCTVVINNSEIKSNYIGVYQNGSYGGNTFEIHNTKITDTNGVGVYISNSVNNEKQTLIIDGCTISGPSGVEIKHTNATITKSTLIGTSKTTSSGVNGNGTCTNGYAFAVSTNDENDKVTGTVSVSDCEFYSGTTTEDQSNGYVFVYKVAEGSSVTINGTPVTHYNTYGGEVSEGGSEE